MSTQNLSTAHRSWCLWRSGANKQGKLRWISKCWRRRHYKRVKQERQYSRTNKHVEKRKSDLGREEMKVTILNAVSVENEKTISKCMCIILELIHCSPRTPEFNLSDRKGDKRSFYSFKNQRTGTPGWCTEGLSLVYTQIQWLSFCIGCESLWKKACFKQSHPPDYKGKSCMLPFKWLSTEPQEISCESSRSKRRNSLLNATRRAPGN